MDIGRESLFMESNLGGGWRGEKALARGDDGERMYGFSRVIEAGF